MRSRGMRPEARLGARRARAIRLASWFPALGALVALACVSSPARAQILFGKNKVQYERRDWFTLRTPHTEIFFYPDEEGLAREVASVAESTCAEYDTVYAVTPKHLIPILLFSSHQAFQQTNAARGLISESTGGLTELIKGRVLIPHTGSRSRLVWVTRHELAHAYMLEKLSRVLREHHKYRYSLPPLWFVEGLAEFLGTHWDSQAEGLLQDAVVSGVALPVNQSGPITGTVLMYKEGQSFLLYLAQRYSKRHVMNLLDNWWKGEDFNEIFRLTFGRSVVALDDEWFQSLKRDYYPRIASRHWPAERARRLTSGSSFNLAPACLDQAPDSSYRFAFLSAGEGATDLEMATVRGGKVTEERLLRGGFSARFESFHLFRSRIGASAVGRIALVSQRGGRDVLHLYDVAQRRVVATWAPPGIVSLSSPSWLPGDSAVVIVGQRPNGQIDLFRVRASDGNTTALTDDPFEEQDPTVNPDGRRVVFASDRQGGAEGLHHLYELDLASGKLVNLTSGAHNERDPAWSPDGTTLVFRSDREGIDDLYLWRDGRVKRLASFLGPSSTPTWRPDGRAILFTAESRLTFHVHELPVREELSDSGWVTEPVDQGLREWPPLAHSTEPAGPYRRRLGLDVAQNGVALDPSLGAAGAGQIAVTDLLGDETLYLFLSNDSENFGSFLDGFEAGLTYFNQGQRLNYGGGLFRLTRVYDPDLDVVRRERRVGGLLIASYPFNKFTRLEGSFVLRYAQDHFLRDGRFEDLWLASNFLTLVHDNSRWTEMGPSGGVRCNLSGGFTRDLTSGSGDYFTTTADLRGYVEPVRHIVSATRLLLQDSFGDDAQRFYLGGRYNLRGYDRRFLNGKHTALVQQEFRFPLWRGLRLGFPVPWEVPAISGALFADAATAGDKDERFEKRASFGVGVYLGGGYFPTLRWNFIRRHDFVKLEKSTITQFVVGFNY